MDQTTHQRLTAYIVAHQEDFYRLAFSYVKNRDEALDLVQEAVVRALQKLSALRQPEYMKTWFYRILVNECLMYLRKRKIVNLPYEDELLSESVSTDLSSLEMLSCIEKLEPKLKTVVFLRFYEDMKLEEIANSYKGVERTYAIQAGREVRVMVQPEVVDEAQTTVLAHDIAKRIEDEMQYPGQVKVVVIRESRAIGIAK